MTRNLNRDSKLRTSGYKVSKVSILSQECFALLYYMAVCYRAASRYFLARKSIFSTSYKNSSIKDTTIYGWPISLLVPFPFVSAEVLKLGLNIYK